MFTDCAVEGADIPPKLPKEKTVKSMFVQTDSVRNEEISSQAPQRQHAQIQTDNPENKTNISVEFDIDMLRCFLNKVSPLVCTALEKNITSRAFDRYRLLSDNDSVVTSKLHSLERQALPHEFYAAGVSWNSMGTAVAVAYGNKTHESWCDHDSSVAVWSLNRKDFDSTKPTMILETDCCITCTAFHNELPAVLAIGKFNGEIVVWNISKDDDPLIASSESTFGAHREPITGLHWLTDASAPEKSQLVSCSLDGKILTWKINKDLLEPVDGFIVLTEHLPRNLVVTMNKQDAEVGVTSMSINMEDPSIFIIGIEGGGIFQCSFNSTVLASYSGTSPVPLKCPTTMSFDRHKGHVTSVQFSPFLRNVFLSSGSDGELRIYSLLQPKPVMIIQLQSGIKAAQWSPARPLVLSCVSDNGQLLIWDVAANETSPAESLSLTVEKYGGSSLQHNKENHGLIATSTLDAQVQIWQLSSTLTELGVDEVDRLQELMKNVD